MNECFINKQESTKDLTPFHGSNEASFKKCGLIEAAKGYYSNKGGETIAVKLTSGIADSINISKVVMDTDIFISIPKFKTHGLTIITGAVKNSYGIIPGAQKAKLHFMAGNPWTFNQLIVDVFQVRIPNLFIVDAIVGMEGNGPTSKDLRDIGLIIASDNAVAIDATIARLMGLNPSLLSFLHVAQERGLGHYDEEVIEIIGELEPIPGFKLPQLLEKESTTPEKIKDVFRQRTLLRPKVDKDLCTGCGTCVEHCPASALYITDEYPRVATDVCITCFCCQEMCPVNAIQLQ